MTLPLTLIAAHFVGDFVLQSDWMALNKSKNNEALALHCLIYTSVLTIAFSWPLSATSMDFFSLTFLLHFATDWLTSRVTGKLWFFEPVNEYYTEWNQSELLYRPLSGRRHWFFVMIGFDQLVHMVTLAWTLRFLM